MRTPSTRAEPLPPEQRRAALIAATLPLVLRQGANVSTKQIAAACNVAEGTIFRVFRTKDELVDAAIASAFDPTSSVEELDQIDLSSSLVERLEQTVEILQRRFSRVIHLMDAIGSERSVQAGRDPETAAGHRTQVVRKVADLIRPFEAELRLDALEAARRLWLFTFAGTHPRLLDGKPIDRSEIISTLLDGIRTR
jgi:AcrR family transcriptional regulator